MRRPVTLTAIRLATSGATVAAIAAGVFGDDVSTTAMVLGLVVATSTWLLTMSTTIGAMYIDGASYGHERRFPLRPPVTILAGPAPLAWAATISGISVGPLLLGAQHWAWGVILTALGLPVALGGARALHSLSRRWLVFVPARCRRSRLHDDTRSVSDDTKHDLVVRASDK